MNNMERIEKLKEFKSKIEDIDTTYYYEETYTNLLNTCIDYQNENQEWFTESCFEEYIDSEILCYEIKKIVEDDDLARLYYFLNDVDLRDDLFRINAYGNLENVEVDDLRYLKQDIIDRIDEEIDEEESGVDDEV